jgi:hypothetical protein
MFFKTPEDWIYWTLVPGNEFWDDSVNRMSDNVNLFSWGSLNEYTQRRSGGKYLESFTTKVRNGAQVTKFPSPIQRDTCHHLNITTGIAFSLR